MFLVYYGARPEGGEDDDMLVEVHAFLSGGFIITLHHRPCAELDELRARLARQADRSEQFIIYRVLDALTDSFFPALEGIGIQIEQLEAEILEKPTDEHLERIFDLRRHLVSLRRVVSPQRDLLARATDDILDLPGLEADTRNYFRDVYDHMLRISDLIDSYRDLLASSRDAYLSMVSNRLNSISKQLTIVATIFLPLAFVTGIFGQNFKWMTDHIQSFAAFAVFGVGGLVVAAIALLIWFRRGGSSSDQALGEGVGTIGGEYLWAQREPPRSSRLADEVVHEQIARSSVWSSTLNSSWPFHRLSGRSTPRSTWR